MVHVADLPDRVQGECAWRDHLPDVGPEALATLNRSGKNRVDDFLVLAFREIDRGRSNGLIWPDVWKNGAGHPVKRWADHVVTLQRQAYESAQHMRDTLPELRRIIASLKKAETALKRKRPGARPIPPTGDSRESVDAVGTANDAPEAKPRPPARPARDHRADPETVQ